MAALLFALFLLDSVIITPTAQSFHPCPPLGPFFPAPRIDPSSAVLQQSLSSFTKSLENYVQEGDGDFGPITPNTTSFSITLFAGSASEPSLNQSNPFFYEYHHTAPATSAKSGDIGPDSQLPVGALTQLFTVYALLVGNGTRIWNSPITEYLPELLHFQNESSAADPLSLVQWQEVTLGSLASHMAGIGRDSHACSVYGPCNTDEFLAKVALQPPSYLPDTTPLFSNAAFQLLASVLERTTGQPFATVLQDRIFDPLNMTHTALLTESTPIYGDGLTDTSDSTGEPAALSLLSSPGDLSAAGRAMLASTLLPSAGDTRRWLEPAASTSNLRNAVGRPWEIYHFGLDATDPVVDIYTKTGGGVGRYASYFGLSPDHDVGFAIVAYDDDEEVEGGGGGGGGPDLNAYADVALEALLAIDRLGRAQAKARLAGAYRAADGSSLVLRETGDSDSSDPGLSVETLALDGGDRRAEVARLLAIESEDLDVRLYPTNLRSTAAADGSLLLKFHAVYQDRSAPVDQGTPTCVTWMGVDGLGEDGEDLDGFVFHLDGDGNATAITVPGFDVELVRY